MTLTVIVLFRIPVLYFLLNNPVGFGHAEDGVRESLLYSTIQEFLSEAAQAHSAIFTI